MNMTPLFLLAPKGKEIESEALEDFEQVLRTYEPEKIVYLCGEDLHVFSMTSLYHFFLREFKSYFPQSHSNVID